jgi:hypothetical protein
MSHSLRYLIRKAAVILFAAGLAACAKKGPPPPPPLLEIRNRDCVAEPNFATARPVILDEEKPTEVKLDAYASCWQPKGHPRDVYTVFELPGLVGEPYILSVASKPLGEGLFAPRLILFDAKGNITREVPHDDFKFHAATLYVGIRVHEGERFLVVASDSVSVGKQVTQIQSQVNVKTISTGYVTFNVYSGSERNDQITYALNGSVIVTARPMPKLN